MGTSQADNKHTLAYRSLAAFVHAVEREGDGAVWPEGSCQKCVKGPCWACSAAVEGQLWGPALLLARVCGDRAFSETAAAMAAAAAAPGTPLHSLLHVLAGRPDLVLPAARGAPGGASPGGPAGQPGRKSGPPSGSFGLKALLTGSTPQVCTNHVFTSATQLPSHSASSPDSMHDPLF